MILSQQLLGVFGILTFPNLFVFHLLGFVGLIIYAKISQIKLLESVNFATLRRFQKELLFSLIVFLPLFALVAGRFVNALYQIPAEYDNLAYHLPFVVEWLRTGDLKDIYYSAFAGPISIILVILSCWICM